jgi:phosphoribosylamine--glycine ligase
MKADAMNYRGFIFFGLMVKGDQCYLLEYNVRLGDPETQAVLPLMDFDLVELCEAVLARKDFPLKWKPGAVCAPAAVAEGYPGPYRKGDVITIDRSIFEETGARLFWGGVRAEGLELTTAGGRVLTVSAFGKDAGDAWSKAYRSMEAVHFAGMGYRKDIGRE